MENVENYEITWTQELINIAFTDLFGAGDSFGFTPQEMTKVRDGITAALDHYWVDFPSGPAGETRVEPTAPVQP